MKALKWAQAFSDSQEGIEHNPDHYMLYFSAATSLYNMRDYVACRYYLKMCEKFTPDAFKGEMQPKIDQIKESLIKAGAWKEKGK